MKAVKAARATAVVAMKVPRAFATSRLGGYLGTGQMPLSTPKYRFLALQLTSSVKLDIKIAINTQGNYCKALFIVFTTGFVLEMAHVQIRGGVADWYWTADLCSEDAERSVRKSNLSRTPSWSITTKIRRTKHSLSKKITWCLLHISVAMGAWPRTRASKLK